MKNKLILSFFIAILFFAISSCGEPKKDAPQESAETEQSVSEKTTEVETPTPVQEEPAESITEIGEAPVAEPPQEEAKPKVVDFSKTPLKCQIVNLNDVVIGSNRKLNKEMAKKMTGKGQLLVVVSEAGKLYFVYNADGSFAGKNLAKYANNTFIGILGTVKKVNGINVIIVDMIESMD